MRYLNHNPVVRFAALTLLLLGITAAPTAAQSETVEYYGLDALGSVRVIFNAQGAVVDRMDYGPFGENLRAAIKFPVEQFAQLARDAESGQDYAQARNYSTSNGRFNRVDPVYAGLFDPQQWNRYTYARNAPTLLIDPEGEQFRVHTRGCHDPQFAVFEACGGGDTETPGIVGAWSVDLRGGTSDRTGGGGGGRGGSGGAGGGGGGSGGGAGGGGGVSNGGDASPNLAIEFLKGCGEGAAGFVDGVIPFADPFQSLGAYDASSPAAWWSQPIAGHIRNFAIAELSAGAILGQAAIRLASSGRNGNQLARTISSGNPYLRLGVSSMGGPTKTPALRIGNATSEWGRWLTHVDLRPLQVFSQTAPTAVKGVQQCLR